MKLSGLFNQLKELLNIETPERLEDKAAFIKERMLILPDLNLSDRELRSKIGTYLEYSSQGVFNGLAFGRFEFSMDKTIVEEILNSPYMYKLNTEEVYYSHPSQSPIKAYYDENHKPKIALILSDNTTPIIKTFVDKDELQLMLKKNAISNCYKLLSDGQIDPSILIENIIKLSPSRDKAFENIILQYGNDLSPVLQPLKNEYNLETQLDKLLRDSKDTKDLEKYVIHQLEVDGTLESYTKSRINKNSILPDAAQRELILSLDNVRLSRKNEHENQREYELDHEAYYGEKIGDFISPQNEFSITALAKEHDTLFNKIKVGSHSYWINPDQSVKVHPERVAVPKLSADSVDLALSAAMSNFGNQLKVNGTEEFKELIIQRIAANEKFNPIQLGTPELQEKLNILRGKENNQISTPAPIAQAEIKVTNEVNQSKISDKPEHASNLVLLNLATKTEHLVTSKNDVINYFKTNFPESISLLEKVEAQGFVKEYKGDNPKYLADDLAKALNNEYLVCNSQEIIDKVKHNLSSDKIDKHNQHINEHPKDPSNEFRDYEMSSLKNGMSPREINDNWSERGR